MAQYPSEWEAQKAIKHESKKKIERLGLEIGKLTLQIELKAASIKKQKEILADMHSELNRRKAEYVKEHDTLSGL